MTVDTNSPCEDLAALLERIRVRFSVDILTFDNWKPRLPHPGVSGHSFTFASNHSHEDIDDETFLAIRDWVVPQGWQMSRQALPGALPERTVQYVYLARQIPVNVEMAFHATRTESVRSIMHAGLLPGTRQRINTDRVDCIGNLYITETLGQVGDEERQNYGTAYWWREHLARTSIRGDSDWSILAVHPDAFLDAMTYRDMWSRSGVVVVCVDAIQPRYVSIVA